LDRLLDQSTSGETTTDPEVLVSLGDVAELTLGQDGDGTEDKRREYS
jgi:hypothetical protein